MRRGSFAPLLIGALPLFACTEPHLDAFASEDAGSVTAGKGGASGNAGDSGAGTLGGGSSGSSGTSGSAGSGGSGGSAGMSKALLIDDFEDGDTLASASDGYWYDTNDGQGVQQLEVEATSDRASSMFALHTTGVGFTAWGALVGLDLEGSAPAFDASAYSELRFWARAAPGSRHSIRVSLLEPNGHYELAIELEEQWREFVVPFSSLERPSDAPAIDVSALDDLQFFVLSDESFDFWLDDLRFSGSGP